MRAHANRELGRLDAEAQAIAARRALLEEQLKEIEREEIEREEMLAEAKLAWNASQRHDARAARAWLRQALARVDDLRARVRTGVSDKEQLDVLWLAAQLTVSIGRTLLAALPKRIETTSTELAARREPSMRSYERWFEIYGPLVTRVSASPDAVA